MDLSGKYIDIVPDPSVSDYARATIRVSEAASGRMTLAYDPRYEHQLGYLVAHECGHVIRLYGVREESRLVPVTTAQHRANAIGEWYPHLERLNRRGIPDYGLAQMVSMWLEGIVRQVWNFPADMRIERWIRTHYPGLASLQEEALKGQLDDNLEALANRVQEMTPPKVYQATNQMNAAYARYMSRLLGARSLFSPYRRTCFGNTGRELADEIWDTEDQGYLSDVEDAKKWAQVLDLVRWFEWRPLPEAQKEVGFA